MRRALLGTTAALCLLALTSQAADDKKSDKENLQGTWAMVAIAVEGKTIDIPKEHQALLIINGDKLTMKDPDKKKDEEGSFKIDEKKKHIDLTNPSDKDPKILETTQAIYSLDGDTLKLGLPDKGAKGDRPKGFDDKEIGFMVLKRVKPTDLDKLQGTWIHVAREVVGSIKVDIPKEKSSSYTFKGDRVRTKEFGTDLELEFLVKLDETKKSLDMTPPGGKGTDSIRWIYSIEGETLKMVVQDVKAARPKGFDDKGAFIEVFKRGKLEEKWLASVELTDKAGKGWLVKEAKVGAKLSSDRDYLIAELPKEIAGGTYVLRPQDEIKGWLAYSSVKSKKDGTAYVLIMNKYLGNDQFGAAAQEKLAKDGWKEVEGQVATTFPAKEAWGWKAFKKEIKEGEVILQLDNLKWDNRIPVLFVFK